MNMDLATVFRRAFWCAKFILACLGAGFLGFLLLTPAFVSNEGAAFSSKWGLWVMLAIAAAVSPIVWRKLK